MLKISSVRLPPPGLMGKLRSSESDSVNAGAGFPTSVFTSIATLEPPSGLGKVAPPAVTGTVVGDATGLGFSVVTMAGYEDGKRHSDADEETQDQRPVRTFSRIVAGAHAGGWMVKGASKSV
jgi:hypothetical protein